MPLPPERRDEPGWPGAVRAPAAEVLHGLGLAASLSYGGSIRTTDDGRMAFRFDVSVQDGTAAPTGELTGNLGSTRLRWPESWTLRDVAGLKLGRLDEEERETRTKAEAFLNAVVDKAPDTGNGAAGGVAATGAGKKVLFVDNRDSFVHTLGDYVLVDFIEQKRELLGNRRAS